MGAKLILLGGDPLTEYELGAFSTLGRHPDNTIQVLDRIVSKEHARVTLGPNGQYILRDVGSLNGTFVNGERVDEHMLKSGDQVSMGSTVFGFHQDAKTGAHPQLSKVTMMPGQVQSEPLRHH